MIGYPGVRQLVDTDSDQRLDYAVLCLERPVEKPSELRSNAPVKPQSAVAQRPQKAALRRLDAHLDLEQRGIE